MPKKNNELAYFIALQRITMYHSPERIRKTSERDYGLGGDEAIEMAYENVLNEARMAIKGKRRPSARERTSDAPQAQEGTNG